MGIQPDFIVARSQKYLDQRRKDRFALFCNMHPEDIISNPDLHNIYELPLSLSDQKMEERIMTKLGLEVKKPDLSEWKKLVESISAKKTKTVEIAIIGKYFGTGDYQLRDSYAALFDAIDHAKWQVGVEVKTHWIDAEKLEKSEDIEKGVNTGKGQIIESKFRNMKDYILIFPIVYFLTSITILFILVLMNLFKENCRI